MRALLDVNFLIALTDEAHAFHRFAADWFIDHAASGWASCPLTQNGCVRIQAQPRYPNPCPLPEVAARLSQFCAAPAHVFFPDDVSLLDPQRFDLPQLQRHSQITDLYLLALAVKHNARLVTFDRDIAITVVRGATAKNLLALVPH